MRRHSFILWFAVLLCGAASVGSQCPLGAIAGRLFRVTGPTHYQCYIEVLTPDGWLRWTNGLSDVYTNGSVEHLITIKSKPIFWGRVVCEETPWEDYLDVKVTNAVTTHRIFDPAPPKDMVLIPAGTFMMGDSVDGRSAALPVHEVYVSACYMDQYEVTRTLWDTVNAWATNHGYAPLITGQEVVKGGKYPVRVDWGIAARWCNARSEMEGLTPCYYTDERQTNVYRTGGVILQNDFVAWRASGYRLPTEAEWEKAARAGARGHRFPWSDTNAISQARANYMALSNPLSWDLSSPGSYHPDFNDGVWPYTNPVDWFPPNRYGLYGMAGNIAEWCWDWQGDYPSTPQSDPHGPEAGTNDDGRSVRGGSFGSVAGSCGVAFRSWATGQGAGFRCVRIMAQ